MAEAPREQPSHDTVEQQMLEAKLRSVLNEAQMNASYITDPETRARIMHRIGLLAGAPLNANSINSLLSEAQSVAVDAQSEAVESTRKDIQSAFNSIELSAVAQARVNARVSALAQGRAGDYVIDVIDPDGKYDAATRSFLVQRMNDNPVIADKMSVAKQTNPEISAKIEGGFERAHGFVKGKIASAQSDMERKDWEKVQNFHLMRMPGIREALSDPNLSPQRRHEIIDKGMASVNAAASEIIGNYGHNSKISRLLHSGFSKGIDGRDFDKEEALQVGSTPEAQALMVKYIRSGGVFDGMTQDEQRKVAAAIFKADTMGNFAMDSQFTSVLKEMQTKLGKEGPEHDKRFAVIMDQSAPKEARVEALMAEMKEHNLLGEKSNTIAGIRKNAEKYVDTLSRQGDNLGALLSGKDGADLSMTLRRQNLERTLADNGYSEPEIAALKRASDIDPSRFSLLEGAARVLEKRYPEELKASVREQLSSVIAVANNNSFADTFSRIRYYNLADSDTGSDLLTAIQTGKLVPEAAAARAQALQADTLARMEPAAKLVPQLVADKDDYTARLTQAGMFRADGGLDVEKLIETARHNRDKLDAQKASGVMTDEQVKAVAARPYNELSDADKDMRVIARTAARFKAIDAIKVFGQELNESWERVGNRESDASEDLKRDTDTYSKMVNKDNLYSEQEQRAAIDGFLKRQQYLRASDELRGEVTADVVKISIGNPNLLRSAEFIAIPSEKAVANEANGPASAPATVPAYFTIDMEGLAKFKAEQAAKAAQAALAVQPTVATAASTAKTQGNLKDEGAENAGDTLFGSKLKSGISAALEGQEMAEIVKTFGSLLGEKYNKGDQNNITKYELRNAVVAKARELDAAQTSGESIFKAIDADGDKQLTIIEITAFLAKSNVTGGGAVTPAAGQAAPLPALTAQKTPVSSGVSA